MPFPYIRFRERVFSSPHVIAPLWSRPDFGELCHWVEEYFVPPIPPPNRCSRNSFSKFYIKPAGHFKTKSSIFSFYWFWSTFWSTLGLTRSQTDGKTCLEKASSVNTWWNSEWWCNYNMGNCAYHRLNRLMPDLSRVVGFSFPITRVHFQSLAAERN